MDPRVSENINDRNHNGRNSMPSFCGDDETNYITSIYFILL